MKILYVCSMDKYANITDFRWYMHILVFLTGILPSNNSGSNNNTGGCGGGGITVNQITHSLEEEIAMCVMDIALRVTEIRNVLVRAMLVMMGWTESGSGSGLEAMHHNCSKCHSAPVSSCVYM